MHLRFLAASVLLLLSLALAPVVRAEDVNAEAPEGDVNADGEIDAADLFYLISSTYYYGEALKSSADFDQSGVVDEADIQYLTDLVFGVRPLTEGVIGPAGGTLEKDGFSITIPAGALTVNAALTVLVGEPLPDALDPSTKRYTIYGIPQDLSEEIIIKLPLLASAQKLPSMQPQLRALQLEEKEYVGIRGWAWFNSSRIKKAFTYMVESGREAYAAGERLVTKIADAGIAAADTFEIMGVGRHWSAKSDYFEFLLTHQEKENHLEVVKELGTLLDEFRRRLGPELGMPWSPMYVAKIRVIFEKMTLDGEAATSIWGQHLDYLKLNTEVLGKGVTPDVRTLLVHELFHLLQNNYDPRWYAKRRDFWDNYEDGNMYIWWQEATSVWAEDHFGALPPYQGQAPNNQRVHFLEPFKAFYVEGTKEQRQRHGYGMAALVKHLVDRSPDGPKIIGRIYKDLYNHWLPTSAKHSVKAVFEAASAGEPNDKEWWHLFFRKYLERQLWPNSTDEMLSYFDQNPAYVIKLSPGGSEYAEISLDQKDLSAQPILIELSGSFGADDALTVSALQIVNQQLVPLNGSVMFFGVDSKKNVTYLGGEGFDAVLTQPDLAAIAQAGQKVLALVFNSYKAAPYTKSQIIFVDAFLGRSSFSVSTAAADITGTVTGMKNVFKWNESPSNGIRTYGAHVIAGTPVSVEAEVTLNRPCLSAEDEFEIDVFGTKQVADPCGGKASLKVDGFVPYPLGDESVSVAYVTTNEHGAQVVIFPWGEKW